MRVDPTPAAATERPPSPCINVCALDARGFCIGCLRTADEIGRWMSMSPAEQWQLLAALAERRKHTR
ncbi:MAG TPA: DUF1289 domain-containing protein [Steroidobacteraceae bacterium]|nr:DUF1289 domain-containing protein [Steroidobacteraceae bacterium]